MKKPCAKGRRVLLFLGKTAIKQYEAGAKEQTADDIAEPMDTGNKPADYHKGDKAPKNNGQPFAKSGIP